MVTYGFYNSLNGDRKYNSEEISSIFDGLILDGVFMAIGNHFQVLPPSIATDHTISVGTGRAWFNHTWTLNDSKLNLEIPASEVLLDRIDAVILEVDHGNRKNMIYIIPGTAGSNPQKPTLKSGPDVFQYPLAYVRVNKNSTTITAADIENCIGTSACPFVTGIIQTINADDLLSQWEAQFDSYYNQNQGRFESLANAIESDFNDLLEEGQLEFETWFSTIQGMLDNDVAGHLTNEILSLKQELQEVKDNMGGTNDNAIMHRNTYRGKWLGEIVTEEQKDAVKNGTFDDLYIGDYWGPEEGKPKLVIMDFNYFVPWNTKTATGHTAKVIKYKPHVVVGDVSTYFKTTRSIMSVLNNTSGSAQMIQEFADRLGYADGIDVSYYTGWGPTANPMQLYDILPNYLSIYGSGINSVSRQEQGIVFQSTDTMRTQLAFFRLVPPSFLSNWVEDMPNPSAFIFSDKVKSSGNDAVCLTKGNGLTKVVSESNMYYINAIPINMYTFNPGDPFIYEEDIEYLD